MTPQEINKRIAEACGFVDVMPVRALNGEWYLRGRVGGIESVVPNYHVDLNLCYEMVKDLGAIIGDRFLRELNGVCYRDFEKEYPELDGPTYSFYFNNASAPQRCEAFLRVKGLWEDGE